MWRQEKLAASWETQLSPFSLNDFIHVRWLGSRCFECWQIGTAVGPVHSMLCSHAFGISIKLLTERTLNYLSLRFTTVDTGDPHRSCSSRCYARTHARSLTTVPMYLYRQILVRGHTHTRWLWPYIPAHAHTEILADVVNLGRPHSLWS